MQVVADADLAALTDSLARQAVPRVLELTRQKAVDLDRTWNPDQGTPVFTVEGRYTTRGWTEWTQGFQYGLAILAGDGLDDLELRWSDVHTPDDAPLPLGYVYSFNGPHSLFVDTMRSMRILMLAHQLGHTLMGEQDTRIKLLGRAVRHAFTTDRFILFHGDSGHTYDVRGRTAHEAVFNRNDGRFRCRSSQQGYSPFSTWTRGLAWAMLGFAEQLEALDAFTDEDLHEATGLDRSTLARLYDRAARETCDHYLGEASAADGVTYWDDGAPGLAAMPDWRDRPADPENEHEPVDASASAIAAQGLIRLGRVLGENDDHGRRYLAAGLQLAEVLMKPPYLSESPGHQGLLLHSIYHQPNGWDPTPAGAGAPRGESSMWGDYHLVELAILIQRMAGDGPDLIFFDRPSA